MEAGIDLAAWPSQILSRLDIAWTLILLIVRYASLVMTIPGLGQGMQGVTVRMPAVICFSFVSMVTTQIAPVPNDMAMMAVGILSEVFLGSLIGMIPLLVVSGAQAAGQTVTGSIGLNGAQLFDPTANTSMPDLARIYGDLSVVLFIVIGGPEIAIQALSLIGRSAPPGSFFISEQGLNLIIDRSAHVFRIGIMIASPVIVALLLTNFVMGLIVKAVPTVNIFAVSFPITIGIGLVLSMIALPEMFHYLERELRGVEKSWSVIVVEAVGKSD